MTANLRIFLRKLRIDIRVGEIRYVERKNNFKRQNFFTNFLTDGKDNNK